MKNYERYLQIPYMHQGRSFQGADCFGITMLFYANELQITLKDFTEDYAPEWWINKSYFLENYKAYNFTPTNTPEFGNIVFFRNNSVAVGHCGIVLTDGSFLHMTRSGAAVTSLILGAYARKIQGYYKYKV